MATEKSVRTFIDILDAIVERAKIATSFSSATADTQNLLKRIVNDRYHQVSFSKKWPWRSDTRVMVTSAKYTTGTASVTNGQKEVDLSAAATIDSTFEGRYFRVNSDQEYYEIISVNDAANGLFLLSAPYKGTTDTAASYTIFRNKYGLYPDYADIIEITPFGTANVFSPKPLEEVNSEEMSQLQSLYPFRESQYPTHYTIEDNLDYDGPTMGPNFVMGYDFMGQGPETQSVVFFPNIFNSTAVQVKYGLQVTPLVEDTDLPIIPFEKRRVLVNGGLSDWYSLQGNKDMAESFEGKFSLMLSQMKADFDKAEVRVKLTPSRGGRRRLPVYPRVFPEVD